MQSLPALVAEWVVLIFIAGVGLIVLWKLYDGTIKLTDLLTEIDPSKKASMSRLQLLLFTFVIAGLYLTLSLEAGKFVDVPTQVLGLLGISGASYVISKGIQKTQ